NQTGISDHNSIGRNIAQTLAVPGENATQAADKIAGRQCIDEAQQVARDDLIELKPHSFGVDHSQAKKLLADGLTAPRPFAGDSVSNADNKIAECVERSRNVRAKDSQERCNLA